MIYTLYKQTEEIIMNTKKFNEIFPATKNQISDKVNRDCWIILGFTFFLGLLSSLG